MELANSPIIQEFLEATGISVKNKESKARFHARVIREANKIDDDAFEALSDSAQNYLESCIDAMNEDEELPDPPDIPDEEKSAEEVPATEAKTNGKAKPKKKAKGKSAAKRQTRGRDRFGLLEGSKSSVAAAMFAKGAKMADVKAETGITHYNLFKKLKKDGHQIDTEGGVITLTHADDL